MQCIWQRFRCESGDARHVRRLAVPHGATHRIRRERTLTSNVHTLLGEGERAEVEGLDSGGGGCDGGGGRATGCGRRRRPGAVDAVDSQLTALVSGAGTPDERRVSSTFYHCASRRREVTAADR